MLYVWISHAIILRLSMLKSLSLYCYWQCYWQHFFIFKTLPVEFLLILATDNILNTKIWALNILFHSCQVLLQHFLHIKAHTFLFTLTLMFQYFFLYVLPFTVILRFPHISLIILSLQCLMIFQYLTLDL